MSRVDRSKTEQNETGRYETEWDKTGRYKLVIFDFDGTLADTSSGIFGSIRFVQKEMNLPQITLEQMYSHVGPPMEESYRRNFHLDGRELERAVTLHRNYAIRQGYKELKLYDGILTLLDELRRSGCKTAVATLKAHETLMKILEEFTLAERFDVAVGVPTGQVVTKAELLEKCVNRFRINKKEAVLVGDSEYDAAGAAEAGIDFAAVTYGFGFSGISDAIKCKPVQICSSVECLYHFLLHGNNMI